MEEDDLGSDGVYESTLVTRGEEVALRMSQLIIIGLTHMLLSPAQNPPHPRRQKGTKEQKKE